MGQDVYANMLEMQSVDNDLILKIGQYGWGGFASDLPSDDCDSIQKSGLYKTTATTFSCPVVDTDDCIVFSMPVSNQIQQQLFFVKETGDVYTRKQEVGSYSNWSKMLFTAEQSGGDADLGNIQVTNIISFRNPQYQVDGGSIEQNGTTIIKNDSTTIELDDTGITTMTANGSIITIDETGIKTNKDPVGMTSLVNRSYADNEVIILPYIDDFYPNGIYQLPTGYTMTDFHIIRMYGYVYYSGFDKKRVNQRVEIRHEVISAHPTDWRLADFKGTLGYSYMWADTSTTYELRHFGNLDILKPMMIVGYLKR